MKMKSYKEMNYNELLTEEERVKSLLKVNRKPKTHYQNSRYLQKIQKEIKEYENNINGRK